MSRILAIAGANYRRTVRDRLGLFFVLVLPIILIIILGITYGGQGTIRVGVADLDRTDLSGELIDTIVPAGTAPVELRRYATKADLEDAVGRGFVTAGLVIDAGYEAALRGGTTARLAYVAPPTEAATAGKALLERGVTRVDAIVRAARFASERTGVPFDEALAIARTAQADAPGVGVELVSVADADGAQPSGFSMGAQSQLILFMFLTSLTGATELIVTRELGITRRMVSTPTSTMQIILGEGLGRLGLAVFQGVFIVVASSVFFGVDWGDLFATTAIAGVFAFVCAGAAMLVGVVARNASQAGALGPALGMGLGLLGGAMVPPEVFPEIMQTLAHATPHAWAIDGLRDVAIGGSDLFGVLPEIAVLLGFAGVLIGLATFRFRRAVLS
jgi:ABC-2 type transport system permease protein